jgi:hypothetical protein
MNFDDYKAIEAVNASALKQGATSMLHMKSVMDGDDKEPSDAMKMGTLVHSAVLENKIPVNVWAGMKRGKAYDAFVEECGGEAIVTVKELSRLQSIRDAVSAKPDARRLISLTEHEVSIEWNDPVYGKAKARIDGFNETTGMIEFKTCRKINKAAFFKAAITLGYDIQIGWYCEGISKTKLHGAMPDVYVIAAETEKPFDVAVWRVPQAMISIGRKKAIDIATRYHEACLVGKWPGVCEGIEDLEMPEWYLTDDLVDFAAGSEEAFEANFK